MSSLPFSCLLSLAGHPAQDCRVDDGYSCLVPNLREDFIKHLLDSIYGFLPGSSVVKNLPASAGDTRDACSILGSGRSLAEGNGNPLQYSCGNIPQTEETGRL